MGGFFGGVADAIGSVVNPISTIAGSIPVVGPIAGPVAGFITGGPLGAATSIAGQAITGGYSGGGGGGGGGGTPAPSGPTYGSTIPGASGAGTTTPYYSPTYNYGANSYSVDNNPFDTSKYFIQGNKGTYNVLPQLADLYGNQQAQAVPGTTSSYVHSNIMNQMRDDSLAQSNFLKNFARQEFLPTIATPGNVDIANVAPAGFNAPDYLKEDIQSGLREYYPASSTQTDSIPLNYADFGFKQGDTLQNIANYAKQQNNPFFMPYAPANVRPEPEPYRAPTIMPVPSMMTPTPEPVRYRPSEDVRGPAPRDLSPTSVTTAGSFRPVETASPTARTAAPTTPAGGFRPVNIRTGGLATLRRKA